MAHFLTRYYINSLLVASHNKFYAKVDTNIVHFYILDFSFSFYFDGTFAFSFNYITISHLDFRSNCGIYMCQEIYAYFQTYMTTTTTM